MSDVSAGTTSVSVRGGGVVVEATTYGFIDLVTPPEPSSTQVNRGLASVSVTTLTDSFVASVDKTNRWPDSSVATVWDAATQSAKIPCTSSYWSLNTPQGAKANYDFNGSYVFAKITPATGGTGTRETLMEIQSVDSVNSKISFYVSGATLFARTTSGGVNTAVFSAAYDPVNHLWLRLREAGGTTFYDTSPDAHTWTNFASTANPAWDIAHISVGFTSGYYGTETAADTFIDNVNFPTVELAGGADGVATVTGALAAARALAGRSNGRAGDVNALLLEPFDSLAAWTVTGSGISISTGRTGTGALVTQGGTSVRYTIPAVSESDTVTVGFAFLAASLPGATTSSVILILRSDAAATIHDRLVLDEFGALSFWRNVTQLGASSPAGVIAAGTWAYIEVQAKLNDTTGFGTVLVNGVNVISVSGVDTKNAGTKTTFDTISLERGVSIGNLTYDDLYADTGATSFFRGDLSLPVPPITGTLTVARDLAGQSDGVTTATGALIRAVTLAGQADGVATAAASLARDRPLAGQSDGVSTATGSLVRARALAGQSDGVSTAQGTLARAVSLVGASAGAGVASDARVDVLRALGGSSAGAGGVSGSLVKLIALAGRSDGAATVTAALVRLVALVGQSDGVATDTATLALVRALAGSTAGVSTVTADLTITHFVGNQVALAGQSDGISTAIGTLSVARGLAGRSDGVSGASASLALARALAGRSDGVSGVNSLLAVARLLAGQSDGTSTVVGLLRRAVGLVGRADGLSSTTADLTIVSQGGISVWSGTTWVRHTATSPPFMVWNGVRWDPNAQVWDGARWQPLNPPPGRDVPADEVGGLV